MQPVISAETAGQRPVTKIVAPGGGRTTYVFGVRVDVLQTGEETAGSHCTYECIVAPGDGPPPHIHLNEDEAFYIVEGEFEVLAGDRTGTFRAGSFVHLPRGVPHTFRNVGQATGRLLGMAHPAGHEHFFVDVDRLSRNGPLTPEEAVAVCRRHGMEVVGL